MRYLAALQGANRFLSHQYSASVGQAFLAEDTAGLALLDSIGIVGFGGKCHGCDSKESKGEERRDLHCESMRVVESVKRLSGVQEWTVEGLGGDDEDDALVGWVYILLRSWQLCKQS